MQAPKGRGDASEPDIICVQELFCGEVIEAYRDRLPEYELITFGRAFSTAVLLQMVITSNITRAALVLRLSTWTALLCSVVAVFWNCGLLLPLCALLWRWRFHRAATFQWWLGSNVTGLAILVRRNLRIVNVQRKLFTAQQGDLLNLFNPRGALTVDVADSTRDVGSSRVTRIINTHLDQATGANCTRLLQAEQVMAEMAEMAEMDARQHTVVCADMNCEADSEAVRCITACLCDVGCNAPTWDASNPLTRTAYDFTKIREICGESSRIDFCFASRSLSVRHSDLVTTLGSDHHGLLVDFEAGWSKIESRR